MKNKPEITYEEFCQLPFVYTQGLSFDWGAQRMYRNEEFGFQIEVVTKRQHYGDIYGGWGEEKRSYFLDGDVREFATGDQLYVAYMEKVCGEQA